MTIEIGDTVTIKWARDSSRYYITDMCLDSVEVLDVKDFDTHKFIIKKSEIKEVVDLGAKSILKRAVEKSKQNHES
jgi:hypothetical protein